MPVNYLNNKDILKQIHKSKNSYCSFVREDYDKYDIIVPSLDKIKSGKGYIYTSEKIVSDEYEIPDNINGIVANARIQNLKLVTSENPITLESLAPSLKLIKGKGLLRGVKQVVSKEKKVTVIIKPCTLVIIFVVF